MIVMLNKLLPKIFPRESPGFFSHTVDDKLVNNSGSDVTADKRTPPINAPDNFVFLSNKSTYIDALIDNNTTAAAALSKLNKSYKSLHYFVLYKK